MELPDLIEKYRRLQREAERVRATGSLAPAWEMVVADLVEMKAPGMETRYLSVEEVAEALGLKAKTVRGWCRQGRFPGAIKSGEQDGGNWLIPADAVYRVVGQRGKSRTPRLMEVLDVKKAS
ncbi:MAG: helix-turn-helix domain-containing protein [Gemmatimonadetes bacterium]|nr:helix-turn-helix domain-containing protein [Gemmatimonadota bacterium]